MYTRRHRLQLVLDNLPALVAFLDTNLCYNFANRLHFSWFGIDAENLSGRPVDEVLGAEAWSELRAHYREALAGETSSFMGEVPFASGGRRFIHSTAVPLADEDGRIEGILAMASDLTEHKLIEQALDATTRRSQTVLDTAVDGIITIDENGIMQSCNLSAQRLFGYREEDLLGRNVSMLMPPHHADNHDGYLQRYLETGEKHIIGIGREVTGRRKDGSEFPMELAVGEFVQNGRHYFTGFTRDITDRKQAEREARSRLNELAHVARLSTIHNLASGLAHEINQPLTAVVTMAQALLRGQRAGMLDGEKLETTLDKIIRQGVRASNIIQQMREFVGKGRVEASEPHDIDVVIDDVLQLLEHEIEHNGISIDYRRGDGSPAHINRVQIEQVVLNLLKNAVEAMGEIDTDRCLTITTAYPGGDAGVVQVSIEDTGAGLPDEGERLFDSFFSTKAEGMGQGLSICRSIIEAHGGSIDAGSTAGGGAVFTFTLPLQPPEEEA